MELACSNYTIFVCLSFRFLKILTATRRVGARTECGLDVPYFDPATVRALLPACPRSPSPNHAPLHTRLDRGQKLGVPGACSAAVAARTSLTMLAAGPNSPGRNVFLFHSNQRGTAWRSGLDLGRATCMCADRAGHTPAGYALAATLYEYCTVSASVLGSSSKSKSRRSSSFPSTRCLK